MASRSRIGCERSGSCCRRLPDNWIVSRSNPLPRARAFMVCNLFLDLMSAQSNCPAAASRRYPEAAARVSPSYLGRLSLKLVCLRGH
jgi:hypothetical protein